MMGQRHLASETSMASYHRMDITMVLAQAIDDKSSAMPFFVTVCLWMNCRNPFQLSSKTFSMFVNLMYEPVGGVKAVCKKLAA
jgi:hypothetical protein